MTQRPSPWIPAILTAALVVLLGSWSAAASAETTTTQTADGKTVTQMQAEYVGMESCAACHEEDVRNFQMSPHARVSVPGPAKGKIEGCEMCHGPGSLHVDAGGGKGVHIVNPGKNPDACFACHTEKKMEFRLPYHHPVLEGKMSCTDCHEPHGMEAKPGATSIEGVDQTCFKCHSDKRGPFVMEHEAMREGCTSCHKVHGSINDKMLTARDNNLCLRCHTEVTFPSIAGSNHRGRLFEGSCYSADCHQGVHGSNFDDHLRE